MTEHQLSLANFYAGWDMYQKHLVEAIAPLTPEQLDLRISPEKWSVGMLTTHIINTRVWHFHTRMGEGSDDIAPLALWDRWDEMELPTRTVTELVDGLERSWQVIEGLLNRKTIADLFQTYPHPEGGNRVDRTLQWLIWSVLEHEIHHGGELSCILGAHGLEPINLE